MSNYTAVADSLDVVVRDASGREIERFPRTGLESQNRMDRELMRRGYMLIGDWWSKKQGGNWTHTRSVSK